MKIYAYILSFLLFMTSCDGFLEYKDNDRIIPSELEQYAELIYGEILIKSGGALGRDLTLMTDDVGNLVPVPNSSKDDNRNIKYYGWYTWAKEPQIDSKGEEYIDNSWEYLYHSILMCNIIEFEVNALSDDMGGMKLRLLGEVQCMRAICYYYLVGMYGAPYRDSVEAKTAIGVPINQEVGIYDKLYARSTLKEVYDLMEKNFNMALDNFEKGEMKNTIFRPNADIARLFLSRIYLTQKRYDKVVSICNDALSLTTATITSKGMLSSYGEYDTPLFNKNNSGILFTWMDRWSWTSSHLVTYSARYLGSNDLKELYKTNDVRLSKFFGYAFVPIKENYNTNTYSMCYRVEEFYFNRAEANIELGDYEIGMDDINIVRGQRINDENYKLEASSKEDAVRLFREEKRREFCFEDIRWYDMKRWGVKVTHIYNDFNNPANYEVFVLDADSPNYILPLPLDIQRRNDIIEKIARVDTKVTN